MALFRMAFFRLFALVFRHFAWRISFFRLFAWRYFVFSLFRLAFFRYFILSLGVISSWRRAITPAAKRRKNEITKWHKRATIARCTLRIDEWFSTLPRNIAPGKYIVIKVEYGLQLYFKIFLDKSDRKNNNKKIIIKMLKILDYKILSL